MPKKGRIKVRSDTGKVFWSRVVTSGPVQEAFKQKIGTKVGSCIKANTEGRSHTKAEKIEILHQCLKSAGIQKGMEIGVFRANSYYRRKKAGRVGGGQSTRTGVPTVGQIPLGP